MFHTLSILIENEAGALSRVAGLFSAQGYNIDSLTVSTTEDPTLSRITLVTSRSAANIAQIKKQLSKLIGVINILDLSDVEYIERELMLIKMCSTSDKQEETKRIADNFRGRVIDVTEQSYTIELTGSRAKLDHFIESIDGSAIVEIVRTGAIGIGRGEHVLKI